MKQIVVIATGNQGKLKEFYSILGSEHFEFKSLHDIGFTDEIIEDGKTFEDNAVIKARAVHAFCNLPVMADDSGIEVDALGGRPGIYTARFAGVGASDQQNNTKLLSELNGSADRGAQFVCALCYIDENHIETIVRGEVRGVVLDKESGSNGFGYDPLFMPNGYDKSFGQMTMQEKKSLSHRGEAIKKIKAELFPHIGN
jgi:XTP/dITP diphosphohydrolase